MARRGSAGHGKEQGKEEIMARAIYRHGVMNKTEARYAMKLRAFVSSGLVKEFAYEAVKLRIGEACFYTPDFMVINVDDVVEFHEVKGFWRDDARVKIKAAAEKFPFRFIAVQEVGGKWKYEEIKGKQGDSIVGGQK